jgi:hypothetical protein
MYTRGAGARRLIIGVYVDGLIITGSDREELTKFKVEMQKVFKMSDLGVLKYYQQTASGITVSQGASQLGDLPGLDGDIRKQYLAGAESS